MLALCVLEHSADLCEAGDAGDAAHGCTELLTVALPPRCLTLLAAVVHELDLETADAGCLGEHVGLQFAGAVPGRLSAHRGIEREHKSAGLQRLCGKTAEVEIKLQGGSRSQVLCHWLFLPVCFGCVFRCFGVTGKKGES